MSPALLEEVTNLVEHPVAILGNFDAAYLDLPKEVLVTCLEHHQKYFPVEKHQATSFCRTLWGSETACRSTKRLCAKV